LKSLHTASWNLFSLDNTGAFFDSENLARFDLLKGFRFLSRGPLDFDPINHLGGSQSEVKPQVTLGHDTSATVDFIDLRVIARHNPNSCTDGGSVTFGPDQFDLDPVVPVPAFAAKK
jgi:hypothetical protein